MISRGRIKIVVVIGLVTIVGLAIGQKGIQYLLFHSPQPRPHIEVTAYFDNTNGVFNGDDVRIRGVNVGKIEKIEPEPKRVKVTFWFDAIYKVPAEVKAVILSPTLVTARAIQLTPPYRSGPTLGQNAVISQDRTAVPVEWDEVRTQLQRVVNSLQPDQPGGVSSLGTMVHTTAENLRGQGSAIRDAIIKLSKAISVLGDHSGDIFSTVKNASILVSALQDSTGLLRQLNQNLASVSGLLVDDPGALGSAIKDVNDVLGEVKSFVAENREALGTTSDKLTSFSTALTQSLDDIKQTLHVLPTVTANAANLYQPAQGTLKGIAAINNFANPISFLCGAIQAASRLGGEQSAKLCVQYLAPIIKNRQYNFLPLGENLFIGATARPNEVTYSEDWMRPDYVPPQPNSGSAPVNSAPPASQPIEASLTDASNRPTDPAAGLKGMMIPPGTGP